MSITAGELIKRLSNFYQPSEILVDCLWSVEDIRNYAENYGIELTQEHAECILDGLSRTLSDRMCQIGWDVIHDLFDEEYKSVTGKELES